MLRVFIVLVLEKNNWVGMGGLKRGEKRIGLVRYDAFREILVFWGFKNFMLLLIVNLRFRIFDFFYMVLYVKDFCWNFLVF